ncbi:MAG TPA: T9SS type A sorting domain-containing protein [Bacteroidales bacterium]|nr:T9SS type A sorting domain-containing protein [Bacteroidales bacterium]
MKVLLSLFVSLLFIYPAKTQNPKNAIPLQPTQNGEEQLDSMIWSSFLGGDNWKPSSKQSYIYDSNGKKLQRVGSNWKTDHWVPSWRDSYFYDEDGYPYMIIGEGYNAETFIWDTTEKEDALFDERGNKLRSILYEFNTVSREWEKYNLEESVWNEACVQTAWTSSNWNIDLSRWDTAEKSLLSLNIFGKDSILLNYERTGNDSPWSPAEKTVHYFDDSGRDTVSLFLKYEEDQWKDYLRFEYEYPEDGKVVNQYIYNDSQWDEFYKYEYSYTQSGNQLIQVTYSWSGESWQPLMHIQSYYSAIQTKTSEIKSPEIQIYPNPSKDYIIIDGVTDGARLQLYTLEGKLVMNKTVHSEIVSVREIPNGTYIFRLMTNEYSQTGKILINR